MKVPILISFLFLSISSTWSQRIDFGIEIVLPGLSGSVVQTDYHYLTDDPVSFHFARIDKNLQFRPGFVFGTPYSFQFTYRKYGIKYSLDPVSARMVKFDVVFPHPELGEQKHKRSIAAFGLNQRLMLKYTVLNLKNLQCNLMAGGSIFFSYFKKFEDSENMFFDSEVYAPEMYKYMLWDDRRIYQSLDFGFEVSWLNSVRTERRVSLTYSHLMNRIGYNGFNQGIVSMAYHLPLGAILPSLKRNKIYLEK